MQILKLNVISTLSEMYSFKSWLLARHEKWTTIVNFFFFLKVTVEFYKVAGLV